MTKCTNCIGYLLPSVKMDDLWASLTSTNPHLTFSQAWSVTKNSEFVIRTKIIYLQESYENGPICEMAKR